MPSSFQDHHIDAMHNRAPNIIQMTKVNIFNEGKQKKRFESINFTANVMSSKRIPTNYQ